MRDIEPLTPNPLAIEQRLKTVNGLCSTNDNMTGPPIEAGDFQATIATLL
jgi:hypothetical protein